MNTHLIAFIIIFAPFRIQRKNRGVGERKVISSAARGSGVLWGVLSAAAAGATTPNTRESSLGTLCSP